MVIGIIISLYRWKFRLLNATLWAEDGALFLQQSLHEGIHSIVLPYAGYFHTIPRIITWLSSYLPSILIPHFLVISCFLITLYIGSTVLKKEYEWIFPDIRYRGILFLLILIAPGTPEAFGNLANLHWILYLYLGLLGIRSLNYTYKWWEILMGILVVLSEGATLTLLPLFFIRLFLQIQQKKGLRYFLQELIITISIIGIALLNFHIRTSLSTINLPKSIMFDVLKHSILEDFFSYPWLYKIPYRMMGEYWFVPTLYIALLGITIVFKFFSWKAKRIIPIVFFLSIATIPLMIAISRAGFNASNSFLIHEEAWGSWLRFRYSFLICTGGYIFWVWIFSLVFSEKKSLFLNYLWYLFILLAFVFCFHNYKYISPQTENLWTKNADKIDKVRKNKNTQKIVIPIEPGGWSVTIGEGNQIIEISQ